MVLLLEYQRVQKEVPDYQLYQFTIANLINLSYICTLLLCLILKKGIRYLKGKIATESWRGISSKSGTHTHIEVRNGKKGYAAKSVGDNTLENDNPYPFYNEYFSKSNISRPSITSLRAEDTTSITINWNKAEGAKKYDLYAKLSGGDYSIIAKNTTATSYIHKGLTPAKRYWYYVVAKNDSSESESERKACYTKNTKPTISKVADTLNALTINWNKPTHAVSYTVRRRKYDSSSFEDVKTINNGDTTSWTDNSLTSGCQYYYYIHAECQLDDNTWKCNSESQNNYTLMNAVNVSSGGPYSINLSWSAPAGNRSIRYDIQRSTDNANYAVVATVDSNTRSYFDSGLAPNTRYYYRIVVMSDSYCTQTLVNSAVTDTLPAPSGITISANNISVTEGEAYKLDAVVYPDDANDKSVSWISDDSSIASVSGDGTVTAVKAGSTNIHARTVNGYEAVCNVTVNPKYIFVDLGDDFTAYIQYNVNGKYVTRIEDSDVRLWSENGSLNQIWHFIKQEDGSYKILSMATDDFNVLDVSGWGTTSGTNVGTYYDNDNIEGNSSSNQRWYVIQSENGYRLKSQCSNCLLDVAGGGDAPDGTNIQMYEYISHGAQEFNIDKITSFLPKVEILNYNVNVIDKYAIVNFSVSNMPSNAAIYIASYNENKLLYIDSLTPNDDGTIQTIIPVSDISNFKVFVWNIESMKPLCISNEWIK